MTCVHKNIRAIKNSAELTVNREQRRVAESLSRHVLGHAGVIGRVLKSGLADQQVSLAGHDHVVVRFDRHVVPQPVNPGRRNAVRWQAPELDVSVRFHVHRVRYRRERFLQICKTDRVTR